jgi:hypothetical protein
MNSKTFPSKKKKREWEYNQRQLKKDREKNKFKVLADLPEFPIYKNKEEFVRINDPVFMPYINPYDVKNNK